MTSIASGGIAAARSNAYDLFGRLMREGLTPELYTVVGSLPHLEKALPIPYDAGEAAASHQSLLGLNVFPHETMFLDEGRMLGGAASTAVVDFSRRCGLDEYGDEPDHIAGELALIAFLCGAEFDACEDSITAEVVRMQGLQRTFLDEHLLRWLPALVQAIRQQEEPFYATVAELVLELAIEHRRALSDDLLNPSSTFTLPAPPDVLLETKSGLKDIAGYLLTPAWSGIYLSRDDIGRLGASQQIPRGFGDRQTMLTNLLRSAVQYDAMPGVLAALAQITDDWAAMYGDLAEQLPQVSDVWLERLERNRELLESLANASLQV